MRLIRFFSSIFLGLLVSVGLFAASQEAPRTPFGGMYLASSIGYTNFGVKAKYVYDSQHPVLEAFDGNINNFHLSKGAGTFDLRLGIGKQISSFYVGGEISAHIQSIRARFINGFTENPDDNPDYGTDRTFAITMKESYAGVVKFGVTLKETLFYAKVGIVQTRFQINSNYPYFVSNGEIVEDLQRTKYVMGGVGGVGTEVSLTKHLSVFGEASYAQYPKKTFVHPEISKTTYRPSSFSFNLGVKVRF